MTPERLAEIVRLRDSGMLRSDERGLMAGAIDELLSALHLAARMTSFSREPCPLCLSLYGVSEVCALHHEIDELGFHSQRHVARIAELEKQNSRFVEIIAASETAKDVADMVDTLAAARERIAVLDGEAESLRGWCRYALENWAPSGSDKADKMRAEVNTTKETK